MHQTRDASLLDWYGRRTQRDAAIILDYIASQPWCNGSIVAIGLSGHGVMTYPLAATNHPALKAVAPVSTPFDTLRGQFSGGVDKEEVILIGDRLADLGVDQKGQLNHTTGEFREKR